MTMNSAFQWVCHPAAEELILRYLDRACRMSPSILQLKERLHQETSTRLFDWLDYLEVGRSEELDGQLNALGFGIERTGATYRVFRHPGAKLPALVVHDEGSELQGIALLVESIADFLLVHHQHGTIEGSPFSGYRRCCVSTEENLQLWVVERRGTLTLEPTKNSPDYLDRYFQAVELWHARPRDLEHDDEAIRLAIRSAEQLVELVGRDVGACIVAEVERDYWQRRNRAAQIQKSRQDRLGLGWANHDHHTFRSSRRHFTSLVRLFEMLGFRCRERFYAGQEAGWGAQVMENERSGLVLFLDVDLAEDEVIIDFAHQVLPERDKLGTIGLWCALHGDSILQAGMHHLEAQFFFDELAQDLQGYGVRMMEPFSSFSYLKQAFTQGEIWSVAPERIERLLREKRITQEQADRFRTTGALGSHLENLQRREGYKGFNQKNVSFIIQKTDPRLTHTTTLAGA